MQKTFLKTGLLLFFVAICTVAFAQKQNVYFLKDNGKYVSTRDSADYIRIVSEPDSGTKLFNVKEYYVNGKLRFAGKSSWAAPIVLEGHCIAFFPSGKRKSLVTYKAGYMDGDCYLYYPNGKLYAIRKYGTTFINGRASFDDSIIACNDSTGKPLMTDGNGHFIDLDDDLEYIVAEGEVVNGKPEGDWIRKQIFFDRVNGNDTTTFKDHYVKGVFARSSNISAANGAVEFTAVEITPDYPGGEAALGKFLLKNIRYPVYAKENHITGKVYLQFIIEKDGSLTDITVTRSPDDSLSQEALRVMNLSPKWKAGIAGGKPVRVKFTMPINFSLGER